MGTTIGTLTHSASVVKPQVLSTQKQNAEGSNKMPAHHSGLGSLPDELKLHVVGYLSRTSSQSMRPVSREWGSIVKSDRTFKDEKEFQNAMANGQGNNLGFLTLHGSTFSHVGLAAIPKSVEHLELKSCLGVTDEHMKNLGKKLPHLKTLKLNHSHITPLGLTNFKESTSLELVDINMNGEELSIFRETHPKTILILGNSIIMTEDEEKAQRALEKSKRESEQLMAGLECLVSNLMRTRNSKSPSN